MQSYLALATYVLILSAFYLLKNPFLISTRLAPFRAKISRLAIRLYPRLRVLMTVVLVTISFTTLARKSHFLLKSGSTIPIELISPATLSPEGTALKHNFLKQSAPKSRHAFLQRLDPDNGGPTSETLKTVRKFFNTAAPKKIPLLLESDFTWTSVDAGYRGRFLHHYSSILFPYRQVFVEKQYSRFASPQYGFISILPLFFMHHTDYVRYGQVSLLLLIFYVGMTFLALRAVRAPHPWLILSIGLLPVAMDLHQQSFAMAPGFAFYRYLPSFCSVTILILAQTRHKLWVDFSVILGCALLNSCQFNVLLLLIVSTFVVLRWLKQRQFPKYEAILLAPLVLVLGYQVALYFSDDSLLKTALFGSLSEGTIFGPQLLLIFLFPIMGLVLKLIRDQRFELSSEELLAYLSYAFFALYSISFAFSPQHYVGFLLSAFAPIALILNSAWTPQGNRRTGPLHPSVSLGIMVFLLYSPSMRMNYPTSPYKMPDEATSLHTPQGFGRTLRFSMPNQLDDLASRLFGLTKKHGLNPQEFYFFSKDKVFIELATHQNLLPANFDPFPSFPAEPDKIIPQQADRDGVRFMVLDSSRHLELVSDQLDFAETSERPHIDVEITFYRSLLQRLREFAASPRLRKIECESRWCLYQLN